MPGPLGYVHFDGPGARDSLVEFLIEKDQIPNVRRNRWVEVKSEGRLFLGRVVEGPYYHPEEVGRDSAYTQTSILHGARFPGLPSFYGAARVQLEGELSNGSVGGTDSRPLPKSTVEMLSSDKVSQLINISGDMVVGQLDGYPDVFVNLNSGDKKGLPRNVGIFGTVGSGKTNTSQVLIEEACRAGYAVVVLDVEGEYIEMDKPASLMAERLGRFNREPQGITKFQVLVSAKGETERADARQFSLKSEDLNPIVVTELIEATEAQERVLLPVLHKIKRLIGAKSAPRKTVADAIRGRSSKANGAPDDGGDDDDMPVEDEPRLGVKLWDAVRYIPKIVEAEDFKGNKNTYWALRSKLAQLARSGAFDNPQCPPISAKDLLVQGKVSIIDVSADTVQVKNLVIADTLMKIRDSKVRDPSLPKTLIVIEEAHTFVSRENSGRMQATLDMIRNIARRGRKRWLALCFVSQQPAHLPTEIFELCNSLVIHAVKGEHNLKALKTSAGDIQESYWGAVPTLGPGQALITSPLFRYLLPTTVRPAATKRKFTD